MLRSADQLVRSCGRRVSREEGWLVQTLTLTSDLDSGMDRLLITVKRPIHCTSVFGTRRDRRRCARCWTSFRLRDSELPDGATL